MGLVVSFIATLCTVDWYARRFKERKLRKERRKMEIEKHEEKVEEILDGDSSSAENLFD